MPYNPIPIGTAPNDGSGISIRDAWTQANAMFSELYARLEVVEALEAGFGVLANYGGSLPPYALPNLGLADYSPIPGNTFLVYTTPFNAGAGTGAYIQNLILSTVNTQPGSILYIPITFTGTNGTIKFWDQATSSTLLQTVNLASAPGGSTTYLFVARFDGVNWSKLDGHWLV